MDTKVIGLFHRYKNEDCHTVHVAALATTIFDAVYEPFHIPRSWRKILRTAALFHDIGYASSRDSHAEQSARILIKEKIGCFTTQQRLACADIIRMHQQSFPPQKASSLAVLPQKKQVNSCAAILRIADGLDYCHIQDAHIHSITINKKSIVILLDRNVYHGNIPKARKKADLWNMVFPCCLIIKQPKIAHRPSSGYSIISSHQSIPEAARRLLFYHFRIIQDNIDGARIGTDEEHLHELRVALRRMRVLLHLFQKYLPRPDTKHLLATTRTFSNLFGPIRDVDVKAAFFTSLFEQMNGSVQRFQQQCISSLQKDKVTQTADAQEIFASDKWTRFIKNCARYLRTTLRHHVPALPKGITLPRFAEKKIVKYIDAILDYRHANDYMSVKHMHELRKRFRKARYITEALIPADTEMYGTIAVLLKNCATTLGNIHDSDVFLEWVRSHDDCTSPPIRTKLGEKRAREQQLFMRQWNSFLKNPFIVPLVPVKKKRNGKP